MEFKRYMSLKRFGRVEVDGIDIGRCFIFPKIAGSIFNSNDIILFFCDCSLSIVMCFIRSYNSEQN